MNKQQDFLHIQRLEEQVSASLRALTGQRGFYLNRQKAFLAQKPYPVFAPHLRLSSENHRLVDYRGVADAIALRYLHSDRAIYMPFCPEHPIEKLLYETLEQIRVEAIADHHYRGLIKNIRGRFLEWSYEFEHSPLIETQAGILIFAVSNIVWSRLCNAPLDDKTQDLLEPTRMALAKVIGHELVALRKHRFEQTEYAPHARLLAEKIAKMIAHAWQEDQQDDGKQNDNSLEHQFFLDLEPEELDQEGFGVGDSGRSHAFEEHGGQYRIFTTRYDQESEASRLVRKDLLGELREQLDKSIHMAGINVVRLSRSLSRILQQINQDGFNYDQEEGLLDGKRLSQLVTSPSERRLFRQERFIPKMNCHVSFLIDCSGSMRANILPVAMIVDVFSRALDKIGAPCEVVGFTTGAWNGGKAKNDWFAKGRPHFPGRLNEVTYLKLKSFQNSWSKSRQSIAALLKGDLFREGIDGEAVDQTCQRLLAQTEGRKILFVISDGCPMDSATNAANDTFYLENHLSQVVKHYMSSTPIEIYGLGVGLDLSPYYPRHLPLDLSHGVTMHLLYDIMALLQRRRR